MLFKKCHAHRVVFITVAQQDISQLPRACCTTGFSVSALHHKLNQGAWECNFEESMEFFAAYNIYVTGIKNLCQVLYMCVCLVTLRNVGEVLEFATTYNAEQLQQVCQQFIRLNLPALLENRFAFFSCHGTESKQNIFWQIWGCVYGSAHFFCALF